MSTQIITTLRSESRCVGTDAGVQLHPPALNRLSRRQCAASAAYPAAVGTPHTWVKMIQFGAHRCTSCHCYMALPIHSLVEGIQGYQLPDLDSGHVGGSRISNRGRGVIRTWRTPLLDPNYQRNAKSYRCGTILISWGSGQVVGSNGSGDANDVSVGAEAYSEGAVARRRVRAPLSIPRWIHLWLGLSAWKADTLITALL